MYPFKALGCCLGTLPVCHGLGSFLVSRLLEGLDEMILYFCAICILRVVLLYTPFLSRFPQEIYYVQSFVRVKHLALLGKRYMSAMPTVDDLRD